MKTIKVKFWSKVPKNFTGKAVHSMGPVGYFLNGKWHRLDGPAYIGSDDYKQYWINGILWPRESEYKIAVKQYFLLENLKKIKNI